MSLLLELLVPCWQWRNGKGSEKPGVTNIGDSLQILFGKLQVEDPQYVLHTLYLGGGSDSDDAKALCPLQEDLSLADLVLGSELLQKRNERSFLCLGDRYQWAVCFDENVVLLAEVSDARALVLEIRVELDLEHLRQD